jgi:hypothetical protein
MNRLWKEQVICNIPVQKDSRTKVYTEKSFLKQQNKKNNYFSDIANILIIW